MLVNFLKKQEFIFYCYVTSDPSTPATLRWHKTEPFNDLVRDEPPYVTVKNGFLVIMVYPNCSSVCAKYLGEYSCTGDNGYSRDSLKIFLSYKYKAKIGKHITCRCHLMNN